MTALRVAVVGAGLGGLCLTQGLLGAGADARVYERDAAPAARRQGYRLRLDARRGFPAGRSRDGKAAQQRPVLALPPSGPELNRRRQFRRAATRLRDAASGRWS